MATRHSVLRGNLHSEVSSHRENRKRAFHLSSGLQGGGTPSLREFPRFFSAKLLTKPGSVDSCLNRDIRGKTCSIHEGARRNTENTFF